MKLFYVLLTFIFRIIHNKCNVTSNLDMHKGIKRVTENTDDTITKCTNDAKRSLNETNLSSRSPTREWIITKSQSIADQNFHSRNNYKSAQLSRSEWAFWNFDGKVSRSERLFPWTALTRFHRVRKVTHTAKDDLHFLSCSCGFYHRIGIPCAHIFSLTQQMELKMFHIRHWKLYSATYGDGSPLGKYMQQAQDQNFKNEGLGCVVSFNVMEKVDFLNINNERVALGKNTTEKDWLSAQFVSFQSKKNGCTWNDLAQHLLGTSSVSPKNFDVYRDHREMLSPVAERLQKELNDAHTNEATEFGYTEKDIKEASVELSFEDFHDSSENKLHTLRKTAVAIIDDVLKADDIPLPMKENFVDQLRDLKISTNQGNRSKKISDSVFEFPTTEIAKGKSAEKRKKNVTG